MRNSVRLLLKEAQQKMDTYAVYMNYQFMHFSVKAEPAALLSVDVKIDGNSVNLEDVADVSLPADDQFALIPKDNAFLFPISKAIAQSHPEYQQEQKNLDENAAQSEEESDEVTKYILCTMPEVNKDRRDAGMDYVKTLYDETSARMSTAHSAYTAKIANKLVGANQEELDEANDQLKELHDQHKSMIDDYRSEKEKQIEEAYQKYLKGKAESEQAESERQAARGENAGKRINLDSLANEEG